MSGVRFCIVIWFLVVISIRYGHFCGPAEIGQQYTITSTANISNDVWVEWYLGIRWIYYDSSNSYRNFYPDEFNATRTQLIILNVTKAYATENIRHDVRFSSVFTCDLQVYKRARSPTCEPLKLIENQIRTTCTTAEIFPKAKCQFTLLNGESDSMDITGTSFVTYNHTYPQTARNEYYSTSCILQYPVDGLKPGNWTVQVNLYPDLIGVSLALGTTGRASNTIQLSVPTVDVNTNSCPKGLDGEGDTNVRNDYIRKGKRASCLCTRAHVGNPPGTVGWSSTRGGNFANLSLSEESATIQVNSLDTFTCQSTSVLNGSHSVTYTPKYAYGPTGVIIIFGDEVPNSPLNQCSSEGLDLITICVVKQSDVRPGMTIGNFTLTTPDGFITKEMYLDTSDGEQYKSVNKLKVTSGGKHTLVCEAKNPKFSDIKQIQSVTIEVREPPKEPPKISARSSKHGDVLMEGDDVTVICDVLGGYPSVHSVTLTCGQDNSVTSNGTTAQLTFEKIELTCSVINCTCRATHVTACYNVISELPLTVTRRNSTMIGVNEEYKGPYTTTDLVGAIIGSIVGTLVLVAAVALIVFFIRREKAKGKNRNRDRDYDQVEKPQDQRYQNVRLRDPNYLHMKSSGQTPGPEKESAKRKTEHIYTNQVFDDSTDITNTDLNVYSFINDE